MLPAHLFHKIIADNDCVGGVIGIHSRWVSPIHNTSSSAPPLDQMAKFSHLFCSWPSSRFEKPDLNQYRSYAPMETGPGTFYRPYSVLDIWFFAIWGVHLRWLLNTAFLLTFPSVPRWHWNMVMLLSEIWWYCAQSCLPLKWIVLSLMILRVILWLILKMKMYLFQWTGLQSNMCKTNECLSFMFIRITCSTSACKLWFAQFNLV